MKLEPEALVPDGPGAFPAIVIVLVFLLEIVLEALGQGLFEVELDGLLVAWDSE